MVQWCSGAVVQWCRWPQPATDAQAHVPLHRVAQPPGQGALGDADRADRGGPRRDGEVSHWLRRLDEIRRRGASPRSHRFTPLSTVLPNVRSQVTEPPHFRAGPGAAGAHTPGERLGPRELPAARFHPELPRVGARRGVGQRARPATGAVAQPAEQCRSGLSPSACGGDAKPPAFAVIGRSVVADGFLQRGVSGQGISCKLRAARLKLFFCFYVGSLVSHIVIELPRTANLLVPFPRRANSHNQRSSVGQGLERGVGWRAEFVLEYDTRPVIVRGYRPL
eukprot:SAG11_NODE_2812_length_2945_cov_11.928320_1_plen_279_part_00